MLELQLQRWNVAVLMLEIFYNKINFYYLE
jgi:hypothetical protein